ncbi:MAG: hypothetical protein ACFFHD_12995 [Promethearchaeota archaeon]
MSEKEKFHIIIQEIKDIYLFLTQEKPTPDDEIEARSNLIEKILEIMNLNSFQEGEYIELFEDALNKLEKWDTLELWFTESEVPESIQNIIKITDELPEISFERAIEQIPEGRAKADLEAVQIDIDDIVGKVSEQFKGEIDDLKQKIEVLKLELEEKDRTLNKSSQKKVIKTIKPKKEIKLPPPEIKIPIITKPEKAPHIKVQREIVEKKPKQNVGIKSLQDVQGKIEEKLENSIKFPKLEEKQDELQSRSDFTKIPEKPEALKSIPKVLNKQDKVKGKKKPKIKIGVIEEEIKSLSDIFKEQDNIPEIKESKIFLDMNNEDLTEEQEKVPFIAKAPKITNVSVEEIEKEPVKSTGSDLFNVFLSVGSSSSEKTIKSEEAIRGMLNKIQKGNKEEIQESLAMSFVNFKAAEPENMNEEESLPTLEDLPTDKDSLYQELIALEGRRYSLEKDFKEIEKSYTFGSIDDVDYSKQSDMLKKKLNDITSRINKIRRVIASL